MTHFWDAIVDDLREKAGRPGRELDTLALAAECGVWVCGGNRDCYTRIAGTCVIQVDERLPLDQLHAEVAFALAQVALWRAGLKVDEVGAQYIADMLLSEHGAEQPIAAEDAAVEVICRAGGGRSRFSA